MRKTDAPFANPGSGLVSITMRTARKSRSIQSVCQVSTRWIVVARLGGQKPVNCGLLSGDKFYTMIKSKGASVFSLRFCEGESGINPQMETQ